jgi:glucose/arabinose dehydrogenase
MKPSTVTVRLLWVGISILLAACTTDSEPGNPVDSGTQPPDASVHNDAGEPDGEGGGDSTPRDAAPNSETSVDPDALPFTEASIDAGANIGADARGDGALSHVPPSGDGGPCIAEAPTVPPLWIAPVAGAPFNGSTFAMQPPASDDWYIVEQAGRIRIVRNGHVLALPFLDLAAGMGTNFGERGLLSVAFHPNYAQNGRFFVMGTPADASDGSFSPANADAVVEFRRDPTNPDLAMPTKVRDIVVLPASASNHNGGTILFGPDNYLYVGTGDGGGGCESAEPGAVQDTATLFGKILRLDVDAAAPFAAAGNPFAKDVRVYHYGLRNPFRFNFDSVTGDLFIGDVGQNSFEEISVAPANRAGTNFGWPAFEGTTQGTCGALPLGNPSPNTLPIVSVDRRAGSTSPFADYTSIIGGRVYRGTAIPSLVGVYLFADFGGAELGALRYCNGQTYGPVAVPRAQILGAPTAISSFVEGHDAELYVMYGYSPGRLGKIMQQ